MINLQELETVSKTRSIWMELKDFVLMFVLILSFGWLFINAQLVFIMFDNIFKPTVSASDITLSAPIEKLQVKSVVINQKKDEEGDDLRLLKERILKEQLNKKLDNIKTVQRTDMIYKPSYTTNLKSKLTSYHIDFNLLPPDGRIIIPKIWINVHIVNLTNIPIKTIKTANYDKYLYKWVVKYPYTPDPGTTWNVFIFWHSSYYWWKHNPYGSIFAKIPDLRHQDIIMIQWNWKIYKYQIFKKLVLWPYEVDDVYKKYTNGQYLTIMACYPVWTDKQRMVILAKRIK